MSIIPSLILYNPLEIFLLLSACNLLSKYPKQFKLRKIIPQCYILGLIFFIIQYPYVLIENSILFLTYDFLACFIMLPILLIMFYKLFYNNCNLFLCYAVAIIYNISIVFIINIMSYPIFPNEESLFFEFIANITIKIIQFIILGVVFIMKKILMKISKTNLKKSIASSWKMYGESKLTEKLKDEIKK